jgi:hypothetical protein
LEEDSLTVFENSEMYSLLPCGPASGFCGDISYEKLSMNNDNNHNYYLFTYLLEHLPTAKILQQASTLNIYKTKS